MKQIGLIRLPYEADGKATLGAFEQYLPGNMRESALSPRNICVGAVFGEMACGAALVCLESQVYLRWVYVDPQARCCGVGTYLLRGLLGITGTAFHGLPVKCVFSSDMTENGRIPGILERAGFAKPHPAATFISCALGGIRIPTANAGEWVVRLDSLPEADHAAYLSLLGTGELPSYVDVREIAHPALSCCLVCRKQGEIAGVLICSLEDTGLDVRGLFVREPYRGTDAAASLIAAAVAAARETHPDEAEVTVSSITAASLALCMKLFPRDQQKKSTEFHTEYRFEMPVEATAP